MTKTPFHEFVTQEAVAKNNQELMQRMRVLDDHGKVPDAEWEIAGGLSGWWCEWWSGGGGVVNAVTVVHVTSHIVGRMSVVAHLPTYIARLQRVACFTCCFPPLASHLSPVSPVTGTHQACT